MNRKTFIGTIASGIAAALNLPNKANAAIAVIDAPGITITNKKEVRECLGHYDPVHRNGVGDPDNNVGKDLDTWNDRTNGKLWKRFGGKYTHIATAMPVGARTYAEGFNRK